MKKIEIGAEDLTIVKETRIEETGEVELELEISDELYAEIEKIMEEHNIPTIQEFFIKAITRAAEIHGSK